MINADDVVKGATIWVKDPGWGKETVVAVTIRARFGDDQVTTETRGRVNRSDAWLTRASALRALAKRAEERSKQARLAARGHDEEAARLNKMADDALEIPAQPASTPFDGDPFAGPGLSD